MGKVIIIPNFYPADNLGQVTLQNAIPVEAISIVGTDEVDGETAQYKIRYTPTATYQRGVTWSIESGSIYASIDANTGVLTVLGGSHSSVTIKATSTADSSIYATKEITVTYVPLIYSQVNEVTSALKEIDFDAIATDNWMMLFYRPNGEQVVQLQRASDLFCTNGGFGMTTRGGNPQGQKTTFASTTTPTASSRTTLFSSSTIFYDAWGVKKKNGVYYYTFDGTTWNSFASYYYNGKNSSKLTIAAGCSQYFSNDEYGFYLYGGVDDVLAAEFFNEHA